MKSQLSQLPEEVANALMNSSPGYITVMTAIRDRSGKIIDFEYIDVNDAFAGWKNRKREDFKNLSLKKFEDREEWADPKIYAQVVEEQQPQRFDHFEPGSERYFNVVISPVKDGLVTHSYDITDKKKASNIIEQSYKSLRDTSASLVSSNSQLEKSHLDLQQFASVASHDLKEPLRKIEIFGKFLQDDLKDKLDERSASHLSKIMKAVRRMSSLIEDVLGLSKLSNSEVPLGMVDLNTILDLIKNDQELILSEKNASINIGLLPKVYGNQGQFHQLFQNLISNAIKFNESKNPAVEIKEVKVPDKINTELRLKAGSCTCISIKDNGIGFEEQYANKIFGIFQKLNSAKYEGTGIGLAICKKIVGNHSGFIFAESVPGKGSEFFVILPVVKNNLC